MMNNPNEKFRDLLADLERLRNSPPPKPMEITCLFSKAGLDRSLACKTILFRRRKAAIALKRSGGTQPVKHPRRSIMVLLKKPEPLTKSAPAAPPRFVWTGHKPVVRIPAGVVIEGWRP